VMSLLSRRQLTYSSEPDLAGQTGLSRSPS
jgi:hypothetical protein